MSAVERRARDERPLAEARERPKARNASDAKAEPEAAAALPATESAPPSTPDTGTDIRARDGVRTDATRP